VGIRITPSVLDANLADLSAEVARVAGVSDLIHLDVMDAHFVPNLTFGLPVVAALLAGISIPADCHLMIDDPDHWAPRYAEAGAASVTVHLEAARDPRMICRDIRAAGARAAIALKPGTPISALDDLVAELDMILIMTVEPGFGGQSFMADQMEKVRAARALADRHGTDVWVQVDGGIGLTTIEIAAEAGADTFVAGSAVFRADDPAAMVERLRVLAAGART
jgi:ribulose-phosphate 3-epimerase